MRRERIPTPKTIILHRNQLDDELPNISMPCILKLPDSAFSVGVKKANNEDEFKQLAQLFFEKSELILIQEFIPTDFDWRIGVLDQQMLYACKYHMARSHWQIIKESSGGKLLSGNVEAIPLRKVPDIVKNTAVKAANVMGSGLYGVDLKITGVNKPCIIEVNDNPSIDAGYEDLVLKDQIYDKVMKSFLKRIKAINGI